MVSCSDRSELDRVCDKWCKKKLGEKDAAAGDAIVAKVCATMKGSARRAASPSITSWPRRWESWETCKVRQVVQYKTPGSAPGFLLLTKPSLRSEGFVLIW